MLVLLVDVHRAAEDHRRVEVGGIGGWLEAPGGLPDGELVAVFPHGVREDTRACIGLLGDGEHAHGALSLRRTTSRGS